MNTDYTFIDEATITVRSGAGGDGRKGFRREKFVPRGGPDGGDGGRGGDVVLVADRNLATLVDQRLHHDLRAESGEPGGGAGRTGRSGEDLVVRVPVGTLVRDLDGDPGAEPLADLASDAARCVVARGGRGGRGNRRFATSTHRAPRRADPGLPGERCDLRLELRLLADAGLLGFPNVGKSTLIRAVSAARPRVADYPFTTLVPHLGVVRVDETSFVVADVPGLIEGAHTGHGLGTRFLRHLARTAVLVHLLDVSGLAGRDPLADFDALNRELALASDALAAKPQIVAASKLDLAETRAHLPAVRAAFADRGVVLHTVSGATGEGTAELMRVVAAAVRAARAAAVDDAADVSAPA
jgi:GTPase